MLWNNGHDAFRKRGERGTRWAIPALAFVALWAGVATAPAAESGAGWALGEVRDIPVVETRSMRAAGVGSAPGLTLEQVAVVRPNVRPGDRAAVEAQYAVNAPGGTMQVREVRIVQFNETILSTREKIVTRQTGRVRTESPLAVPLDAAPGTYTVTTILAPVAATRGLAAREERAETIFIVLKRDDLAPAPGRPQAQPALPPPAVTAGSPPPAGAPDSGRLEIHLWTEKARHRIGDKVVLNFQSNRDAYVTILNKGTSGKVGTLFPNAYAPSGQVKANTKYTIPGPTDTYELRFSGAPGQDMVVATATVAPMASAAPAPPPGPAAPAPAQAARPGGPPPPPQEPPLNVSIFPGAGTPAPGAPPRPAGDAPTNVSLYRLTRDINIHLANTPQEQRAQKEIVLEVVE